MSFYTGKYKIIADGERAGAEDTFLGAQQHANLYALHNPGALSVTVDRNGLTVYNATPGPHECQAGCGAQLPLDSLSTICEACS